MLFKTLVYILCGLLIRCQVGGAASILEATEVPPCSDGEFRCKSGACAAALSRCNGTTECSDGSDETLGSSDELCDRTRSARIPRMVQFQPKPARESTTLVNYPTCNLPPQPEHGSYVEFQDYDETYKKKPKGIRLLKYTCNIGYKLNGSKHVLCTHGRWIEQFPNCKLDSTIVMCKLRPNRRIEYSCLLGNSSAEGYQDCDHVVPSGMTVKPRCKLFYYYPDGELPLMNCVNGKWDFVPWCIPECGRTIPKAMPLMAGGEPAKQGELPWHVGIYYKKNRPYEQICGGSIISSKIIITAAHCFWQAGVRQRPCRYAVAAGKLYRDWNDTRDIYAQHSDVLDIIIPPRFRGVQTSNQDDLALVVLEDLLHFVAFVRPVCLEFRPEFDAQQLQPGNVGKVAGWGYTSNEGNPSPFLKVAELPIVNITQCFEEMRHVTPYITTDKICAGFKNGTAVCRGDSGGGFAFPAVTNDVIRYYLRGIVSISPSDSEGLCNTRTITTFTHVLRHQVFIENYYEDLDLNIGYVRFDSRKLTYDTDPAPCF